MERAILRREEPAHTTQALVAECVAGRPGASAFLVAGRPRGGGLALSIVGRHPLDTPQAALASWSMRLVVRSAITAGRTIMTVRRRRSGKLHTYSPEVLVAMPVTVHDAGQERVWGALVVIEQVTQPDNATIQTLERQAQALGRLLSPDAPAADPHEGVPPASQDADLELPCGASQDVLLHELRTPLGAAGFALEALSRRQDAAWDRQDEQMLAIARLGVIEAQSIVRWYSQLRESGGKAQGPQVDAIAIDEIIARAMALLPHAAPRMHVVVAESLPPVAVDPLWLVQALTNLLENAAKYASPHEPIYVAAQQMAPDRLLLSVKDTGSSIRADEQHAIFHPYAREGRSDDLTSRGLGLSIARHFVRAMGGDIRVESDGQSSTTFLMTLPVAQQPAHV